MTYCLPSVSWQHEDILSELRILYCTCAEKIEIGLCSKECDIGKRKISSMLFRKNTFWGVESTQQGFLMATQKCVEKYFPVIMRVLGCHNISNNFYYLDENVE